MAFDEEDIEHKLNMLANDSRVMSDTIADFKKGFNSFEKRFSSLETALMGNQDLGIKPVFDRVFDSIEQVRKLGVSNEKRITNIENCMAIDDGVSNERKKIFNFVAQYIFPTSVITGMVAVLWKFFCWVFK